MQGICFKLLTVLGLGILTVAVAAADSPSSKDPKTSPTAGTAKKDPAAADSEVRKLTPFTSINLSELGDLYITQAAEESFSVEADETILSLLKVEVRDKTLYLSVKDSLRYPKAKIKYNLKIKQIQNIFSTSSGTVYVKTPIKADTLNVFIDGLGEADLALDVKKLITKIGGGGRVVATGTAELQQLSIAGAGEYSAIKLAGKNAVLKVSGSGIAKLNVTDSMTVTASEDAVVKYCGSPKIKKQLEGSALLRALSSSECSK